MTVKTDVIAVTPTTTALNTFQVAGVNANGLLAALKLQAGEMSILLKSIIKLYPNDSVLTATVNTGGSGGTNGPATITGTTGTGTKFTAKGNITGGALAGALIITNPGSYTVDPTSLTAEPVTGGSLTGATVGLTISGDSSVLNSLMTILSELA